MNLHAPWYLDIWYLADSLILVSCICIAFLGTSLTSNRKQSIRRALCTGAIKIIPPVLSNLNHTTERTTQHIKYCCKLNRSNCTKTLWLSTVHKRASLSTIGGFSFWITLAVVSEMKSKPCSGEFWNWNLWWISWGIVQFQSKFWNHLFISFKLIPGACPFLPSCPCLQMFGVVPGPGSREAFFGGPGWVLRCWVAQRVVISERSSMGHGLMPFTVSMIKMEWALQMASLQQMQCKCCC